MSENTGINLDVDEIRTWRSIVTLITFVVTNLVVLFPFHISFYVPTVFLHWISGTLRHLRVIPKRCGPRDASERETHGRKSRLTRLRFPMNFITAPLIADLFLLAILAIGEPEIYGGTVGSNNIQPIDIMAFFLTLAYIAISIDASGLIRYLAFRVLSWGGEVGHRLFFYLYAFFFALGSFIGNDPIILSGTAFLAYMTRVSNNIEHPRAWIHTQFAVANIASAILVTSNPTNLVLAGAFNITFINYTANMVVPVVATAIVIFPFLLYIIFAHEGLIPIKITMHELPEEIKAKKPVNPNIPNARGNADEWEDENDEQGKLLSLEEIMNPFLDKGGATFGAVIMTATLATVLAINAASQSSGEHPVFWVTLPAAFVMFCWDVTFGWIHREETREIARNGRKEIEDAREKRLMQNREAASAELVEQDEHVSSRQDGIPPVVLSDDKSREDAASESWDSNPDRAKDIALTEFRPRNDQSGEKPITPSTQETQGDIEGSSNSHRKDEVPLGRDSELGIGTPVLSKKPWSLVSLAKEAYRWCQETFPTVTAVVTHLPFALVPFALCMFVLVEALVTKGWVPVFAYGWDHWVNKTGTIGAVGGMGFLSVILCNFAGTNIGTTILLSRVIQAWEQIHQYDDGISDRTFWATVYAMALGVNYGAFSMAFSGSLAGLLWRDILARKHIDVSRSEFARVNLPIIAIAMVVGCSILVGEVYIIRDGTRKYSL